ncbi:pentapeptide repeat-containing protein [Corynebacterium mastitidis]|uniref:Pentapeptide repeat-containing protein n=1 Tax=Corynebacterium mastitidis TaxID=161890 RepID=A0ABU8NX49_9CORY
MKIPIIENGNIQNIDLSGQELEGMNAYFSSFYNVNFAGAKLAKAHFIEDEFENVSFAHADLRGARFDASNAFACDLTGADVCGAVLPGSFEKFYSHNEGMIVDETTTFDC